MPSKSTGNQQPTTPGTERRRTRLSPEERKEQLLDAAAAVLLEQGIDGWTMESVTEVAQVSRALGYFYFESRTDLIRALYNREFSRLYDAMLPAFESSASLEERVRATVHAYFDVVATQHDLFALLNTLFDGPEFRRDRRQRYRWWERYVGALVGEEFHIKPEVARIVALVLLDINARCSTIWYRDRLDREEIEELCVGLQLGGLRDALGISTS